MQPSETGRKIMQIKCDALRNQAWDAYMEASLSVDLTCAKRCPKRSCSAEVRISVDKADPKKSEIFISGSCAEKESIYI